MFTQEFGHESICYFCYLFLWLSSALLWVMFNLLATSNAKIDAMLNFQLVVASCGDYCSLSLPGRFKSILLFKSQGCVNCSFCKCCSLEKGKWVIWLLKLFYAWFFHEFFDPWLQKRIFTSWSFGFEMKRMDMLDNYSSFICYFNIVNSSFSLNCYLLFILLFHFFYSARSDKTNHGAVLDSLFWLLVWNLQLLSFAITNGVGT